MTNVKDACKHMETKYERMCKVAMFKYLWEIIQSNVVDKEGNLFGAGKVDLALQPTKFYKSKSFFLLIQSWDNATLVSDNSGFMRHNVLY